MPAPASLSRSAPLPVSAPVALSRLLVRIRAKMETTRRRTWFELQRDHYYTHPPAIHSTAELATALQHFHVSCSDSELTLLMDSFCGDSGVFNFKQVAALLYPSDRADGVWGFNGSENVQVPGAAKRERPRSGTGKAGVQSAVTAAAPTSALTSNTSAFPVVFSSPSSTFTSSTAITASIKPAATTAATTTSTSTATSNTLATTKSTAATTSKRGRAAMSSTRPSAALHHPSRYVKQSTSIGRVYTERVYDNVEDETQRTAYIKYVNDGYWTRV